MRARTAFAARCIRGNPMSWAARLPRISHRRTRTPRSTSPAMSRWRSGNTTSPPATPCGAQRGFPVIRETATFWVSRSTFDSVRDRYDIKDVVSVAEGLVGVDDDAYTNAVARRNLEIATLASRRLGVSADPRWAAVAARLHMPMDSVSHFYRTYEGAPDSTLGVITPN